MVGGRYRYIYSVKRSKINVTTGVLKNCQQFDSETDNLKRFQRRAFIFHTEMQDCKEEDTRVVRKVRGHSKY